MSAVLDTVNAFSRTLADELADAVKQQDALTVKAFDDIAMKLRTARDGFLMNLGKAEDAFEASVKEAMDARSSAMGHAGTELENAFSEIVSTIEETRVRYMAPKPAKKKPIDLNDTLMGEQ